MRPRILFVASADSPHAQGWARLLHGTEFDVRLFSVPLLATAPHLPEWQCPTYVTLKPDTYRRNGADVRWLLPVLPRTRSFMAWLDDRLALPARWLRRVVLQWRPHIVHSLPLDPAGKLARAALQNLPADTRPSWIASAWGSDLNLGLVDAARRPNVEFILRHCDGFMADCRRDLDLAERAGLARGKRALADAAPGNGGVDIDVFTRIREAASTRDVIVIPKAFEREHANRAFTVIEALRVMGPEALAGFEVHLLMCSSGVRNWLAQMPSWLRERCRCHGTLPQREFFDLLGRARVVVAPSLADGTANVMLEAMAAGALPLMSPLPSTLEWITEGRTGLTAHALYPDQIAAALTRALQDDDLFDGASRDNWITVCERADRKRVARDVIEYYRRVAGGERYTA